MGDTLTKVPDPSPVPTRQFLTWRLGVLVLALVLVIAWAVDVPRWLRTHPQYEGPVSIVKMSDNSMLQQECGNVVSFSKSINCSDTNIYPLVSNPELSAKVQSSPELNYHYKVFSDSRGETYANVEQRQYQMFIDEICKVYKIENDTLTLVSGLPDELWCDDLYTDFKGTWLVRGMTKDGGDTSDIYLIDDTRSFYVSQFHNIPLTRFFYDSRDGGALYSIDNYSGAFYKVSFD